MSHSQAPKHANALSALFLDDSFDCEVLFNEPATRHTTYHCGGPFKFFCTVNTIESLQKLLRACDSTDMPFFMIGKGSNLLVSDEGFDGVACSLGRDFRKVNIDEEKCLITAGAGVSFAKVSQLAFNNMLSGLEFAVGIPGTVGGALGMNAGTGGVGLCDVISSVSILDINNDYRLKKLCKDDFNFGYHYSEIQKLGIAVECEIELKKCKTWDLKLHMEEKLKKRNKTQPGGHNCGSVFKNPEGDSAGRLIEQAGLKGTRIGGAEISELHANFFPNVDNAKSQDIMDLIRLAQTEVKEKFGVLLEPEVQFLGF